MEKEYSVPEPPAAMVWLKDSICLGFFKKNYMIINSETGAIMNIDINSGSPNVAPYIKAVGDEFYCL